MQHLNSIKRSVSSLWYRRTVLLVFGLCGLYSLNFAAEEGLLIVPPPDITITCDYWFPFDANNPNAHIGEFDQRFGRIVSGPSRRSKIYVQDRVCPNHPRFSEFAPANPADDPCYDDTYNILWGDDGYVDGTTAVPGFQNIVPHLVCNRGYLIREWRAWPHDPVIATQRITIIDCREFYVPDVCWRFTINDVGTCDRLGANDYKTKLVEWPCDLEFDRCQVTGADAFDPNNLPGLPQDKRPRLAVDHCNLLAASYEDVQYNFVDNACSKVFRTWTVIDWCLYEDFRMGNYSGPYEWSYTQVIKLLNSDTPDFADCEDREFCGFGESNDPCSGTIELRPTYTDDCTPQADIKIDYKIDLFDDGSTDRRGYSSNFDVNPFGNLPATQFPDTLANADGTYPVGTHKILWTAEDGCGNISSCQYRFTIRDCKAPTPYCRVGVSTIPMSQQAGGFVDIWASDFNIGSTDNCTASEDLTYSFSDDPLDGSRRFTIADSGLVTLTVYVWDTEENGDPRNFATCSVEVLIEGGSNQTTHMGRIAGRLINTGGADVSQVTVYLSDSTGIVDSTVASGTYGFDNADLNSQWTVRPSKSLDDRNGISTFDLILLAKHITRTELLDSPYKIIAGDVNGTGSLTTFDMVELRKLIIYISDRLPANQSWRFIPADYDFADDTRPFASTFPESLTFIPTQYPGLSVDFVGVKIGDLNSSARFTGSEVAETRGAPVTMAIMDQEVAAGEIVDITFTAHQLMEFSGYQLGLKFDPDAIEILGLADTQLPGLEAANFAWQHGENGWLPMSWHQTYGVRKLAGENLFSLRAKIHKAGRLSDLLAVGDVLTPEYYSESLQIHDLGLSFTSPPTETIKIYPAQPNPFFSTTMISYEVPTAQLVNCSIYDLNGKLVKQYQQSATAGLNQLIIAKRDLSATGVLYVEITTKQGRLQEKLMLLE